MIDWIYYKLNLTDYLGGFPRSGEWQSVRKFFLQKNPTCAVCGSKGNLLNMLNVHHIKSYSTHPELECLHTNLLTVCRIHHLWVCHLGNWKSINENVKEDAEIWLRKIQNRPKWNGKEWIY